MKRVSRIYINGLVILLVAIITNWLAMNLGLTTWYSFFMNTSNYGLFYELKRLTFFSAIFLFLIYPLILGLSLIIANNLVRKKKES